MSSTQHDRRLETALAWFTVLTLPVYAPAETDLAWPDLLDPGYVVDFIARLLLAYGACHSLRVRHACAIAPLAAAQGRSACLAWRSDFTRRISRVSAASGSTATSAGTRWCSGTGQSWR